jgi:hypothetical protein
MGGWNAMSGWFCRSGLGPGPSSGGSASTRNGLAGPSMSPKKNRHTTNITIMAHATSGSFRRSRNFTTTATVKPARISPQSRIDPSRAAHMVATL